MLRTLLLLVARGPAAARGNRSRAAEHFTAEARKLVALALETMSKSAAAVPCALAVNALPDADLQALVDASVSRDEVAVNAIAFLGTCRCHAPLLYRLVGPVGFPLALAKLVAAEGFSGGARARAIVCLQRLVETTREHGPPLAEWAKPIVKPLRTAFARAKGGTAPPESSVIIVGYVLFMLSADEHLITAMASGMPDFVSLVRGPSILAVHAAGIIGNLAVHPGSRAAALREGAVPALVSLLYGKGGASTPAVKALCGEDAAVEAFLALGNLSVLRLAGRHPRDGRPPAAAGHAAGGQHSQAFF